MEDVLQGLEGERRRFESRSREVEELRYESEKLRNQLAWQKKDFEKQKNELLRKARYQADEIYRTSRREAEAVLKELRSLKADLDVKALQAKAEEARKRLDKHLSLDEPLPEGTPLTPANARSGMTVLVKSLRKNGTLLEVKGKDGLVSVGVLKMTVPLSQCLLVKDTPKEKPRPSQYKHNASHAMFVAKTESTGQEVDVRGMTTDEAIPYVDRAIDDALLAGISQVRIIHGKGTGIAGRAACLFEGAPQCGGSGAGGSVHGRSRGDCGNRTIEGTNDNHTNYCVITVKKSQYIAISGCESVSIGDIITIYVLGGAMYGICC